MASRATANRNDTDKTSQLLLGIGVPLAVGGAIAAALYFLKPAFGEGGGVTTPVRIFLTDSAGNVTREVTSAVNTGATVTLQPTEKYIVFQAQTQNLMSLTYRVSNGITTVWQTKSFGPDRQVVLPLDQIFFS